MPLLEYGTLEVVTFLIFNVMKSLFKLAVAPKFSRVQRKSAFEILLTGKLHKKKVTMRVWIPPQINCIILLNRLLKSEMNCFVGYNRYIFVSTYAL